MTTGFDAQAAQAVSRRRRRARTGLPIEWIADQVSRREGEAARARNAPNVRGNALGENGHFLPEHRGDLAERRSTSGNPGLGWPMPLATRVQGTPTPTPIPMPTPGMPGDCSMALSPSFSKNNK